MDDAHEALKRLHRELEWIQQNTRAIPGEGRAVDESWANVRLEITRIVAAYTKAVDDVYSRAFRAIEEACCGVSGSGRRTGDLPQNAIRVPVRAPPPAPIAECSCSETYPQLVAGTVSHGPGCTERDDVDDSTGTSWSEPD